MKKFIFVFLVLIWPASASAAIHAEKMEYKQGDAVLEGYLAYDDASNAKRPGVLIVHEWKGPGPYTERRAREIAGLGYVAFVGDIYGKGVRPQTHEEAAKVSGIYRSDRTLMRERAKAAFDILKNQPLVDASRMAAMGYCFGGTTVLELARSSADVKGVVTFHGGLDSPNPADGRNIKGKILVLRGADDPFVSKENIEAFKREMADAKVDFREEVYPGAVHSFTVPEAGGDPSQGMAYNAEADKKSWEAMKDFFQKIFS